MSEDFKWTDELVREFMCEVLWNPNIHSEKPKDFSDRGLKSDSLISNFKQSKQNSNKDWEIIERVAKTKSINAILIGGDDAFDIKSVRRLSDNEVFSVGDGCSGFGYEEISHFTIAGKEMIASFKSGIFSNIDFLFKKAKQKLFTTLDGKDIYEGDEYWILFIESGSSWIPSNTKASEHTIADVTKSYMKRFSTEELAKEYAIMNKPCLSLNEIKWWIEKYFNYPDGINTNQLKHIVEQKINNGER